MVAQFNSEMFARVSHTPTSIPSDSAEVRLALETAQAFHAMGNLDEAIAWLERAAERAEEAGQIGRVLELVQATAKLMNGAPATGLASTASSAPPSEVRDRGSFRAPPAKLPPCPPPLVAGSSLPPPARTSSVLPPPRKSLPPPTRRSSLPPVPMLKAATSVAPASAPPAALPRDSSLPKGPPRASVPPKRSSRAPASFGRSPSQVKTIRVAIAGLVSGIGSFSIEQLAKGEPLPAGTKEATLVISDDEGRIEVVMRS